MANIGDAYIEVHADTTPFSREVASQLDRVADDAETELNKSGRSMGDRVSDGLGAQLRRRGRSFAKSIEEGTRNTIVRIRSIFRFDQIRDSIRRGFRRDVGDTIAREIGDALDRTARSGVFNRLGLGVADAIGAGFNVSGRSPLIAVLLPAILALVGVIGAAIQAVNALIAVLFLVPNLILAIGLQVGVLAIAFQGLGTAVQGAFAAKNAKELNEALKGLTPSAQSFVRSLLPLREFFNDLRRTVQERFFNQLGGVIKTLQQSLGPTLIRGFGDLAEKAGRFLRQFAEVFSSREFIVFLDQLFTITGIWIKNFGQSLFGKRGFLMALTEMGKTLIPFMNAFGEIVLLALDQLSALMLNFARNPATVEWLSRMRDTLQKVVDLAFNLGDFLFVFLRELDRAGGQNLITTMSEALMRLMFFLSSPVGQKGMEALVNIGIIGIESFTGLLIAFLSVLAAFEVGAEWIKNTFAPGFIKVIKAILQAVVDSATFLGVWIQRIVGAIGRFFSSIGSFFVSMKNAWVRHVSETVAKVMALIEFLRRLPGTIVGVFKNFGTLLVNIGRSLVQGLINGINDRIGDLRGVISTLANLIGRFLPGSPAKEGPLSGQGYVKLRGQRMVQDFVEGIRSEIPALRDVALNATSNIVFGANAVQVNVAGESPDANRARSAGSAVGMAAANMIASRNTRLAVRTL
jgi:hypothetical protein